MTTPVDHAMSDLRPAKVTIRNLWTATVQEIVGRLNLDARFPLYVTLAGAKGLDIQALVDAGIVSRTETGALSPEFGDQIIAIESRRDAQVELHRRFAGLKVMTTSFQSVIKNHHDLHFPIGEHLRACRARIVNLDLDEPFQAIDVDGEQVFPVVAWARKLAILHQQAPRVKEWILFLTLHGQICWTENTADGLAQFLADNCAVEPVFGERLAALIGSELHARVLTGSGRALLGLAVSDQQQVIMAVVPKMIAREVCPSGWVVETIHNVRYGGGSVAPMVTWGLRFKWKTSAGPVDGAYKKSLIGIFDNAACISQAGLLEQFGVIG